MQDPPRSPKSIGEVSIHLVDMASGRPVQTWVFVDLSKITLGRSPDQHVVLSDPYVSRNHAEILFQDGSWVLVSLGLHGVLAGGKIVREIQMEDDTNFRLGSEGPMIRFCMTKMQEDVLATLNLPSDPEPLFFLDEHRLSAEVSEITEGDYFQSLRSRAKKLRNHRNGES